MPLSLTLADLNNTANGSSLALGPGAIPAGKLVVIVVGLQHATLSPTVTSITKTGATVLNHAANPTTWGQINSRRSNVSVWYVESGAGIASSAWTINFSTSACIATAELYIVDAGYNVGSPFDGSAVFATKNAASASTITASKTITVGSLVIGAVSSLNVQTGIADISSATGTGLGDSANAQDQFVSEYIIAASTSQAMAFNGSIRQGHEVAFAIAAQALTPVTGTADQSLAGFSQLASGRMEPSGSATQTLSAWGQLAVGVEQFSGAATNVLLGFSQIASSEEILIGAIDQSMTGFGQAAFGEDIYTGDITQTLSSFGQAAAALVDPIGLIGQSLLGFSQELEAEQQNSLADQVLTGFGQTLAGELIFTGTIDSVIGGFNQQAAGLEIFTGDIDQTLLGFNQVASGILLGDPFTGGNWYSWRYTTA